MMAGILDFIKTPEGQGLLSAAFGGLAGARRGTPLNNIGRAGLSGLMGYSNAIQSDQKAAEDAANQEMKKAQIERMMNPPPAYQTVNGTLVKIPQNGNPEPVFTAPEKSTPLPWYVRNNNGTLSIDPAYSELEKAKAAFARPPAQPMQPVAYLDANGQPIWGTIAEAKGKPAATYAPSLQEELARVKSSGKSSGEADTSLSAATSSFPQIEQTVKDLKDLSKTATYTLAGKARDAAFRQFGIATPGAIAREKYVQTVRDVLFPQLRQTFGAQFTVKEGEALIATLGDPDKTPEERNAALDAFISQKKMHIQSLQRQTNRPRNNRASGVKFLGFE